MNMGINSENSIKDFGEGLGKGISDSIIQNGINGIKALAEKFKKGGLAFIQERSTIDKAKELLNSNEHLFYCTYIEDKEKQTLCVLGLTLRRLDSESQIERRDKLIQKIKNKYGINKLHISYLVQSGVLSRYLTNLLENIENSSLMKEKLGNLLNNLDKFVYFVPSGLGIDYLVNAIKTKITANSPEIFIISGMGTAVEAVSNSFNQIKAEIFTEYIFEIYSSENREIIILNKKD
ncbi:MAG: hypothetical protein KGH55_03310 [Nanoarchaeota archaeon]|nr:hypothetical protein [Nanoarchaeota archaeon]